MKGYMLIAAFIIFTAFGFDAYYLGKNGNSFSWEIYMVFGTSATFALSLFAFWGYLEYIRNEDKIDVFLKYKNYEIPTELKVLRKNCTRGEMQGLLRILSAGKLFKMESLFKNKEILELVDKIQTGSVQKIVLAVRQNEITQFIGLPNYNEVLKKCDIEIEENEKPTYFTKETQQQIDNIEKLLEELKTQK